MIKIHHKAESRMTIPNELIDLIRPAANARLVTIEEYLRVVLKVGLLTLTAEPGDEREHELASLKNRFGIVGAES